MQIDRRPSPPSLRTIFEDRIIRWRWESLDDKELPVDENYFDLIDWDAMDPALVGPVRQTQANAQGLVDSLMGALYGRIDEFFSGERL